MQPRLRCEHCGEVIGIYEPLVIVEGSAARQTSRAAEPLLAREHGPCYHCACHLARPPQPPVQPDA
ncbi:MAG TPA: hypothetical protein VGF95_11770 [Solirubrobacteraceae bacterium]|jgi:hypothetical protein